MAVSTEENRSDLHRLQTELEKLNPINILNSDEGKTGLKKYIS